MEKFLPKKISVKTSCEHSSASSITLSINEKGIGQPFFVEPEGSWQLANFAQW
jgi:hypothetical protein